MKRTGPTHIHLLIKKWSAERQGKNMNQQSFRHSHQHNELFDSEYVEKQNFLNFWFFNRSFHTIGIPENNSACASSTVLSHNLMLATEIYYFSYRFQVVVSFSLPEIFSPSGEQISCSYIIVTVEAFWTHALWLAHSRSLTLLQGNESEQL